MITQEKITNNINLIDIHSIKELNDDDRTNLIENYRITNEILDYADDTNERARLEYDEPSDVFLIVFNAQNEQSILGEASEITLPISFAIKENNIFLFTNNQTHYVKDYIIKANKMLENDSDDRIWSLIFNAFDQITNDYNDMINEINHNRNRIQDHIKKKRSGNSQIFELSNLQDLITYISTSINGNFNVVKQMEIISSGKLHSINLTKSSHEHLHDSIVEIEQIREQASLTSDIIDRVANTYNNILNNQTNMTMKILTIYTIVLSIPTIVSGFYGMNMPLPVSDKKWSWIFSIILTILMIGLILWDLNRRDRS
ncbi:magnesium transporter CorA family protein [Companilactobacillus tucceti DSM 20183]|uniref:Magnesium transporter CorA family protein n=1 Tax=Companilactobacillus tucceti DSM 20183 TaxID=1423811 RepID=A0A0R1IZM7_9LACO|nr:magnesium transporter CorA family protein [Companilactobacillus tucceti]KRK64765.1 magnesium transporter CorA family protein [Companilactobacillus tucceti DSM 20183]